MHPVLNPRSLRTSRTPRLALALALLFALALLSVALSPRPAEAYPYPEPPPELDSMAPTLKLNNSSAVVNEGQQGYNTGSYDDTIDPDDDTVRVTASVGTVTQSYTGDKGTWSWSAPTSFVSADQTSQVTITATDSTGLSTRKVFSFTVRNVPMTNDMFSNATYIMDAAPGINLVSDRYSDNRLATMEAGEDKLTNSPSGKDCGIHGRYNSVWFKITTSGTYNPQISFSTYGSKFDTVLALYKGTSLGTLKQVACSNNNPRSSSGDWTDDLLIDQNTLSTGQTYYLQLSGTGGLRSGDYRLATQLRTL